MRGFLKTLARIALSVIGGLPLLLLCYVLLRVWIDPLSIDQGDWLKFAATVVILEIVFVHSGAFMATGPIVCSKLWQRLAWFLGFGLVYLAAIIVFANLVKGNYVLWAVLGVALSRVLALVFLPDKRGTIMMLQRSVIGTFILIFSVVICFIPLPQLGITEEIRYAAFGVADGFISEHPERMIAWGLLYFFVMSFSEFYAGWHMFDWTDEKVEKTWKALKQ
jgi:hypothetical protein